jgi:hypothetical protein
MHWLRGLKSRILRLPQWHDIATAPLHREIELAVIDGNVSVLGFSCLRCDNGWCDAETLRPINVVATHWRYRHPTVLPVCCC